MIAQRRRFWSTVPFSVKSSLYAFLLQVCIEHLLCARQKFLCFQFDSQFRQVTGELKKKETISDPGGKCPERSRFQLGSSDRGLQAIQEHGRVTSYLGTGTLECKGLVFTVLSAPQYSKSLGLRENSIDTVKIRMARRSGKAWEMGRHGVCEVQNMIWPRGEPVRQAMVKPGLDGITYV